MPAIINFKICDNARECGGIAICPTKAMHYDEERKTIVVDSEKCTNCGLCIPECPIGAIQVGKTEEEYQQLKKDIEDDQRKIKDLFVDRYGASPISDFFIIESDQIEGKIENKNITLIEVYEPEEVECLLKSIPILDLTESIEEDIHYYKLVSSDEIKNKYKIDLLPSLLIFREGELLGCVDGYYTIDQIKEFRKKIENILNVSK